MRFVLYDKDAQVYAGLENGEITLEEAEDEAVRFDERDNPRIKTRYYNTVTGYNFEVKAVK